ncbi:hypothetical protein GQ457_07G014320 [Hibiscus cannabinus]
MQRLKSKQNVGSFICPISILLTSKPWNAILITVQNNLEKENNEFFVAYTRHRYERAIEIEKRQRIQSKCDSFMKENDN